MALRYIFCFFLDDILFSYHGPMKQNQAWHYISPCSWTTMDIRWIQCLVEFMRFWHWGKVLPCCELWLQVEQQDEHMSVECSNIAQHLHRIKLLHPHVCAIFEAHCYTDDVTCRLLAHTYMVMPKLHLVDLPSAYYTSNFATNTQEIELVEPEP